MSADMIDNRTVEEIPVGERVEIRRTLSMNDVHLFSVLSGDGNPAHYDPDFARSVTRGRGVFAHSLWTSLIVSGLLGTHLPGPGAVVLGQRLRHHREVFIGDEVLVSATVISKNEFDRTLEVECQALNAAGELVMEGALEVRAPEHKASVAKREAVGLSLQTHDKYRRFIRRCSELPLVTTAVAHPCDESSLAAVVDAAKAHLIDPILVGPADKIRAVAAEHGYDISGFVLEDVPHSHAAAARAVELVRDGHAELLMKGSLHSDELLSAVASRERGLRTERRLSHVFLMDVPSYHKVLLVTDAAINIQPGLLEKQDICQSAIDLAHVLGIARPKVAVLSAVETITPKIPSTLDAAALCKMADRGQIKGAVLDGPLAMDNAISLAAARTKGIRSEVAGDADILLVPNLEAGNMLAKELSFMAHADAAGIVLGARVPIMLTSRADSVRTRLASCAVGVLMASHRCGLDVSAGFDEATDLAVFSDLREDVA